MCRDREADRGLSSHGPSELFVALIDGELDSSRVVRSTEELVSQLLALATVVIALAPHASHPIATRASGAALQGAGGGLCLGANAATAPSPRNAARSAAG